MPDLNLIETGIAELKEVDGFSALEDYHLFLAVCQQYFYDDGTINYADFDEGFTDGTADGGIDFIVVEEGEESERLVLVQGKKTSDASTEIAADAFNKMHATVTKIDNNAAGSLSREMVRKYLRKKGSINVDEHGSVPITLVLFIDADFGAEKRESIRSNVTQMSDLDEYECQVYFRSEIIERIEDYKNPKPYVEYGKIKISSTRNVEYSNDEGTGMVVNVKANSLKELYFLHGNRLFEQNFRYFVSQRRVDEPIKRSLEIDRDMFWFLNNGIIIGCKKFSRDGKEVNLHDFSIINGCQTVTLIGEYNLANQGEDFELLCKLVSPNEDEEYEDFVTRIAEASNSQKAIGDRDLKANREDQKALQSNLQEDEPKVYIRRKRGEFAFNTSPYNQGEEWQRLDNGTYAQYMRGFHCQAPGSARNSPAKIFSTESVYNSVFRRSPFDKDCIVDTLKIFYKYQQWANKVAVSEGMSMGEEVRNVIANGKIVIPSIVGFILKWERELVDRQALDNDAAWKATIEADTLRGKLFVDGPDDMWDRLNDMFQELTTKIGNHYKASVDSGNQSSTTVTNWFKSDDKYREEILYHLVSEFMLINTRYSDFRRLYIEPVFRLSN